MRGFFYGLSLAFVAAMFLASGIGHALLFARFRGDLRDHGLMPRRVATLVAAIVTAVELVLGAVFAGMLVSPSAVSWRVAATSAAALLAAAFVLYLRRLLRQPPRVLSCGCSFLSGQLTPVSVVPAASLMFMSLIGMATTMWRGEAAFAQLAATSFGILAAGWGATLAMLVLVLPAAAASRVELEAGT
jgi:hypothetical protein